MTVGVAGSVMPYSENFRMISDNEVTHAAILWAIGKDSHDIASALCVHESRVLRRMEAIREIARTFA